MYGPVGEAKSPSPHSGSNAGPLFPQNRQHPLNPFYNPSNIFTQSPRVRQESHLEVVVEVSVDAGTLAEQRRRSHRNVVVPASVSSGGDQISRSRTTACNQQAVPAPCERVDAHESRLDGDVKEVLDFGAGVGIRVEDAAAVDGPPVAAVFAHLVPKQHASMVREEHCKPLPTRNRPALGTR